MVKLIIFIALKNSSNDNKLNVSSQGDHAYIDVYILAHSVSEQIHLD